MHIAWVRVEETNISIYWEQNSVDLQTWAPRCYECYQSSENLSVRLCIYLHLQIYCGCVFVPNHKNTFAKIYYLIGTFRSSTILTRIQQWNELYRGTLYSVLSWRCRNTHFESCQSWSVCQKLRVFLWAVRRVKWTRLLKLNEVMRLLMMLSCKFVCIFFLLK